MKKCTRFVPATLAASVLAVSMIVAAPASAEISANVGYASEYYFRGILQKESSASAGVDYEEGGFYLGTWAADVGDGLEIDVYGGYGFELESGLSLGVGFTTYQYTGDFDSEYNELNLSAAYGPISVDFAKGKWGEDLSLDIPGGDYTYTSVTYSADNGFYGKYAMFGDEADGDYFEFGYGASVSDVDLGVALILNSEELSDQAGRGEALIFSIGKSF